MRLPSRGRTLVLALHIAVSVGWLGAIAAYLALDIAVATSQDPQTLRASYASMDVVARTVIVPLALSALLSGLVISLGTAWGLFRHYWVVISLLLTTVATAVLLVEIATIRHLAAVAANPQTSDAQLRALDSTLPHSIGGGIVLGVVLALNVYKPRGVTRYGWRKERGVRRRV